MSQRTDDARPAWKANPLLRMLQEPPSATSARAFRIVVIFSVLVRLIVLFAVRSAPISPDARDYCFMAQQLVLGERFVPYWPPGLPLYLALFLHAGAGEVVLRASMLLFWLLACWGLYRLMRALEVQQAAWLVLLIFSLLPDSIQLSLDPLTQMPVAALLLVALGSAVRLLRGAPVIECLLLGASLGAMSLVRPSAIPLALLIPVACAVAARRYLPSLAAVALAFAMLFAWMAHIHSQTGRWLVNTANGVNLYYGNNPWTPDYRTWYFGSHAKMGSREAADFPEFEQAIGQVTSLPQLDQSAEFQRLAKSYILSHPGRFLYRTANRLRCFFGFDSFTSAALLQERWMGIRIFPAVLALEAAAYLMLIAPAVFWIAGAPGSFWRSAADLILLGAVVLYSAPYWISMSHPTYHFPVLLPLAVVGVSAARRWIAGGDRRAAGWIAVGALLLIQVEWVWQMSGSALGAAR